MDPTCAFLPTADPALLWLNGQYDDALRTLRVAVLGRQGLLVLVGEAGTGKTALAHALAVRVRAERVAVGRLRYPTLEGMDLLAAVAEAFGLSTTLTDRAAFVEQFRRFVEETVADGRRVLLIVDDAQRLNPELLVELGRLPYIDGARDTASLSVLVIGQRSLLDAFRADVVEPDVLCHLRPLTPDQTADYIAHRLRAVRHRGRLFTPSALRKIWVVSEGIPQAANALCVDALNHRRETGRRTVTASMIKRAPHAPDDAPAPAAALVPVREGSIKPRPPSVTPRRRWASLVGVACLVLTVVAIWAIRRSELVPAFMAGPLVSTAATPPAATPPTIAPQAEEAQVDDAHGAGAAPEPNPVIEVVRQARLPERPRRPTPIAARPQVAVPAPTSARAPDDGDATVVIDWLLKGRRSGGRVSSE